MKNYRLLLQSITLAVFSPIIGVILLFGIFSALASSPFPNFLLTAIPTSYAFEKYHGFLIILGLLGLLLIYTIHLFFLSMKCLPAEVKKRKWILLSILTTGLISSFAILMLIGELAAGSMEGWR